jgi:coenzyme F420-reducing hydrogenase gamma subunit
MRGQQEYDIVLIEVQSEDEEKRLEIIRTRAKTLMPGRCATIGGINKLKNTSLAT